MNKNAFIQFVLKVRDVKRSTAQQHYYVLQRFRNVCGQTPSSLIPHETDWVCPELFESMKDLSNTTQKNMYSSLLVYLKCSSAERTIIDICTKHLETTARLQENAYLSQEMTEKQKSNWVDHKYIVEFFEETQRTIKAQRLFNRETLSSSARRLVQQYLMQAIHGGLLPPPRLEWATMHLFQHKSDALKFSGNTVFLKPRAGINVVVGKVPKGVLLLPKSMASLLRRYCKFVEEGSPIFVKKNGSPHTTNSYGKELQRVFHERFQKRIGASLLRNIYITKRYATLPALKEMRDTAGQMMHSLNTALLFYKKNSLEN